jgi:Ni/Co efflux regulator RcnB
MKKLGLLLVAVSAPLAAAAAQPPANGDSAPATAETSEPATTRSDQSERQPASERRICRRIDSTGSRTGGQRVCMTAEQWRRVDL